MLFPSCFASLFSTAISWLMGFPGGSAVKNPPASAGDRGSTPRSGRSPGEGKGNPLQYSCLENPMHRGAWQATVHGVTKKSQTWLSNWATTTKVTDMLHIYLLTSCSLLLEYKLPQDQKTCFFTASLLASAQLAFDEWLDGMNEENPNSGTGLKVWAEEPYHEVILKSLKKSCYKTSIML